MHTPLWITFLMPSTIDQRYSITRAPTTPRSCCSNRGNLEVEFSNTIANTHVSSKSISIFKRFLHFNYLNSWKNQEICWKKCKSVPKQKPSVVMSVLLQMTIATEEITDRLKAPTVPSPPLSAIAKPHEEANSHSLKKNYPARRHLGLSNHRASSSANSNHGIIVFRVKCSCEIQTRLSVNQGTESVSGKKARRERSKDHGAVAMAMAMASKREKTTTYGRKADWFRRWFWPV